MWSARSFEVVSSQLHSVVTVPVVVVAQATARAVSEIEAVITFAADCCQLESYKLKTRSVAVAVQLELHVTDES